MQTDRVVDPTRFDVAFYLSEYPDVARSGLDPETHYRTRGWREGRDPSPFFSTDFYLDTYADIRAAGIEPLAHYAAHGREEGRAISPSRSLHGAVLARLDAVLAAEPAPAALPEGDADLLMASRFFHAAHYAQVSGQTGPRETLIAEYLSRPLAARPATHPQFCAAFYRETYLSDAPETDPLIDYLRTGRARNRYATPLALARDARLIKAGSGFDTRVYARSLTGPQRFDDAVKDYLLHGQERGGIPAAGFDGAFVTRTYLRPREIACAPYAYYLRNRARPWVFASLAELFPAYCEIVQARLFDPAYYTQVAQIDPAIIDPALHYLLRGVPAGLPCGPAFHTGFYLQRHPDIAAARINPLVHFEQHGAGEGRVAVPPSGSARIGAGGAPSPAGAMSGEAPGARPRAIVVSHEASMTGAPIVALNVARGLAHSHEVIVWLGKEGPLSAEFAACAAQVIHGIPPVGDALGLLKNLAADGPVDLAIVNSALSGAALEPLQRAGIPAILLVHDFATYVYPRGTLSRLVLNAPVSVFPAQVVADAQAEELSLLGAPAPPPGVQIAHQGWNGAAQTERATLDVDAIRAIIGAPDGGGQRVLFGGGWVQPRKGVDLFVQTAARLAREGAQDWRFVWVGGNYRPESDMLLSVYLADHVARAGLAGQFFFFDEQPDLEPFWELADIFLLSSRLDPYPNIALDALMRDVPVVCFDGATGIAELAAEFGFAVRPVPLADPADAADAISDLAAQPAALARAFAEARPRLAHELSFEAYIERLLALADTARAETQARAEQADLLAARPMAELRTALATTPSWARIAPIDTPHAMALSIAALSAAGGPVAPLSASPGAPVELYPDHDPLVRLGGRDAGAPPDPGRWHVHLHLPPGAVLPEAVAPLAGLATVLLSSPLGALAQDALDPLPDGVELLRDPLREAQDALAVVAERAGAERAGAERTGAERAGAAWITHADLGTVPDALLADLLDPDLAAAAMAEADEASGRDDAAKVALILPGGHPQLRPHRAEALHHAQGGAAVSRPVAPAFAGHHRAETLRAFLGSGSDSGVDSGVDSGDVRGPRHPDSAALSALERAALLALAQGAWLQAQGLATFLHLGADADLIEPPAIGSELGMLTRPPPPLDATALCPIASLAAPRRSTAPFSERLKRLLRFG